MDAVYIRWNGAVSLVLIQEGRERDDDGEDS
jgi:hypothetical protein